MVVGSMPKDTAEEWQQCALLSRFGRDLGPLTGAKLERGRLTGTS